jgi:hypothetical protein
MTLALSHVQDGAGLDTGELAHGAEGVFRPLARSSRMHDKAQRDHVLVSLVLEHRTALLGEKRETKVPAAYVLDPGKSRNKGVVDGLPFHKWNVIAVHRKLCLPHRRRPAVPPFAKHDGILNYHKLIVGLVKEFDENVTFRALPLRQVAA